MSGVLAVMDALADGYIRNEGTAHCYISCRTDTKPGDGTRVGNAWGELREARAAVAELAKCCDVTVKAFEALGRTDNVVAQLEAHRECERALIEQKRALARCGGQS